MLLTSGDQGGQRCWERGRGPSWEEGCGEGALPATHLEGPLWAPGSQAADAWGGAGRVLPARRGLQRFP